MNGYEVALLILLSGTAVVCFMVGIAVLVAYFLDQSSEDPWGDPDWGEE